MEIKKGSTRTVLLLDKVVFKFPVIGVARSLIELNKRRKFYYKSIRQNGLRRHYLNIRERRARSLKLEEELMSTKSQGISLEVLPYKKYEIFFNLRYFLFSGIMANWNEYRFYRKTMNPFTMPTYFSLLGLFNIQKRGQEISFWSYKDIWKYICHNSENVNQPFCDPHSFAEIGNFCLDAGKLKMLDYGSRHVHNFLRLNGPKLFNNFVKPPE
ncbi:MAG: hypothetical protein ACM3PZ_02970 [Bacillota bacterium]